MLLSIILSALVSLLVYFFERWWSQNHPLTVDTNAKQAFLSEVGSPMHFWMGKRRLEYAGKLFDKYAARFQSDPPKRAAGLPMSQSVARAIAQAYATGLTLNEADLMTTRLGDHSFTVKPNGLVQGGAASYSLDAPNGVITYQAAVRVGKWFLSKTYNFGGTYKVDPTLLNPTNLSAGKVLTIGDLQMRVVSLSQSSAMVSLSIVGQSASGTAMLMTNQPVVVLGALDATVSVLGMTLVLGLRPA